jgi:hypothetical protein
MIHNSGGALAGERYRVIVSTDIGGSDPDDFQSMAHYLLYSDLFDTEGLISSPWGAGTAGDILEVIGHYETDYPNLRTHSDRYPEPDYLRSITKQGTMDDDPGIKDKLRVYYIGGPNKKWGLNAYEYIRENFPDLWIIENNSTYRGWFVGGNQEGDLGNLSFVMTHALHHGALGDYFAKHLGGVIKMGDTPSVTYLMKGTPEEPEKPGWGGSFVQVGNRPKAVFHRNTTEKDEVEVFAVLELVFQGPELDRDTEESVFTLVVDGQEFEGFYCGGTEYRVRFMPKSQGSWTYTTKSRLPELDGQSGAFTCVEETPAGRIGEEARYPNWWADVLDPEHEEHPHKGAKTVSMWREEFLRDFQTRFDWAFHPRK